MLLRTVVLDCLYLNWALPRRSLPEPPRGLRYEIRGPRDDPRVVVSAVLFRQAGLRWLGFPAIGLSHPQMNLRTYVVDAAGVPSVLFHALMVPRWAGWVARSTVRVPCVGARFRYPRRLEEGDGDGWRWRVRRDGRALEVDVRPGSPRAGAGVDLGDWASLTECLRRRDRGYVVTPRGVRRIETEHESVAVWPVSAEVEVCDLVSASLSVNGAWPALHSAWICPRMALDFEVAGPREAVVTRHVPAPG